MYSFIWKWNKKHECPNPIKSRNRDTHMRDFHFGWFMPQKCSIELILKLQLNSKQLLLHVLWLAFPPFIPPLHPTLVKITTICFREGSYNTSGSRASGWDTCWASLGSVTLATPTARYFTFTSTWHQAHIARGSLFSVSSPHPSTHHHSLRIRVFLSPYIFTWNPLCLHILPSQCSSRYIRKPPNSNFSPNVSHFQVLTVHPVNCACLFADSKMRGNNPAID